MQPYFWDHLSTLHPTHGSIWMFRRNRFQTLG